jgi:hypothetical protein
MGIDVVIAVRLGSSGDPELFKIAHYTGQETTSTGAYRMEAASWVISAVQGGAQIDTRFERDGHSFLVGYLTVSVDHTGNKTLGIDDRNGLGRTVDQLPKF